MEVMVVLGLVLLVVALKFAGRCGGSIVTTLHPLLCQPALYGGSVVTGS